MRLLSRPSAPSPPLGAEERDGERRCFEIFRGSGWSIFGIWIFHRLCSFLRMGKVVLRIITLVTFVLIAGSALAATNSSLMDLKPLWPNVAIQRPIWFCEAP